MKFIQSKKSLVLAVMSTVLLSACDSDTVDDSPTSVTKDVSLQFAAKINGADFNCGQTYTGVGTGGNDYVANDFRMYVHEAHIHDDSTGNTYHLDLTQDGVWQLDDLAMLDFENNSNGCTGTPNTNTAISGKVTLPSTVDLASTEVCFSVGVPADKNHIDSATAVSPLNASGMLWAWKIGRKYIRIDGIGDPAGANQTFNLHLGAQGCPGASATAAPTSACTVPNTFEVCVDDFNVSTDVIAVDPGFVFEGSNVAANLAGAPGCQSFVDDNDCEEIMPRLGLDYTYGRVSGTASTHTAGQRLFSKQ